MTLSCDSGGEYATAKWSGVRHSEVEWSTPQRSGVEYATVKWRSGGHYCVVCHVVYSCEDVVRIPDLMYCTIVLQDSMMQGKLTVRQYWIWIIQDTHCG